MSVLIKGMDIPKNCNECKIKSWDEGENDYVCPFSGVMTLSIGRQDDCPLEEQEPCEDAVSREAAIDAALSAFSRGLLASPDIRKLQSVQPKPHWIPVSERLPEEDHWLGGSGKQFSDNVLVSILNSDDEDEWVDVSQTIDGEWALELPRHCKILAWMPLPEPYRAERRTDGRD